MTKISVTYFESPIGKLFIGAVEQGITFIKFVDDEHVNQSDAEDKFADTPNLHLEQIKRELSEYFNGDRKVFSVKLHLEGSAFQYKVWNELLNIPFGSTRTYMQQTKSIGDPKAIRAVASANGKNKHAIVIPCHRVIGSDGSLTGYAGGMWRKKWLLEFEQKHSGQFVQQKLF